MEILTVLVRNLCFILFDKKKKRNFYLSLFCDVSSFNFFLSRFLVILNQRNKLICGDGFILSVGKICGNILTCLNFQWLVFLIYLCLSLFVSF